MTIDAIASAHRAKPFKRFALVLADGTRVAVRHPELLAHPSGGRTIVVFEGADRYRIIDLLLVSAIEFGGERRTNGNGRRKL